MVGNFLKNSSGVLWRKARKIRIDLTILGISCVLLWDDILSPKLMLRFTLRKNSDFDLSPAKQVVKLI